MRLFADPFGRRRDSSLRRREPSRERWGRTELGGCIALERWPPPTDDSGCTVRVSLPRLAATFHKDPPHAQGAELTDDRHRKILTALENRCAVQVTES